MAGTNVPVPRPLQRLIQKQTVKSVPVGFIRYGLKSGGESILDNKTNFDESLRVFQPIAEHPEVQTGSKWFQRCQQTQSLAAS